MIIKLILDIFSYYKSVYIIILVFIFFVVDRVLINAGLSVNKQIPATFRSRHTSQQFQLGFVLLLVITVVDHYVQITRWPHW